MLTHDFSNWDKSLFDYGKMLISYKGILEFNNSDVVSFSSDYKQKQAELFNNIVEAHLYWIGFGVGVENLIKAVLIKHKVLTLTRRADFDNKITNRQKQFSGYDEVKTYRLSSQFNKYQKVFKHVYNVTIKVINNTWLESQFAAARINHPLEINTPTLHKLYTQEIAKLVNICKITDQEKDEIEKSLEVLKLMRRNVDSHIYLQSRTVGSIDRDIEDIYIPVINLLTDIYKR